MTPTGTHVLRQLDTVAKLKQVETSIRQALRLPGVTALCIRTPARNIGDESGHLVSGIWDYALQIAREESRAFYPRWMAGRYLPGSVITAGPHYLFAGPDHFGRTYDPPIAIPLPCSPDGSTNEALLAWKQLFVEQVGVWCAENEIALFHDAQPGRLWAELNVGTEVTTKPGNTMDNVVRVHRELAELTLAALPPTTMVEWPLSGHGPAQFVAASLFEMARTQPGRCVFQINGVNNEGVSYGGGTPDWAVETGPDSFYAGYQAYTQGVSYKDPSGAQVVYDPAAYYREVREAKGIYYEEYLEKFSPSYPFHDVFKAECAAFGPQEDPCDTLQAENEVLHGEVAALEGQLDAVRAELTLAESRIAAAKEALG